MQVTAVSQSSIRCQRQYEVLQHADNCIWLASFTSCSCFIVILVLGGTVIEL